MSQLHRSRNRDRWYLARDPDAGRVFVRHQVNLPSGGYIVDSEVGAFLTQGNSPEQQQLLRLIGTLVDETPDNHEAVAARPNISTAQGEAVLARIAPAFVGFASMISVSTAAAQQPRDRGYYTNR